MNLTDDKLKRLDNPDLTPDERASLRCRFAAEYVHAGRYEAAREALGHHWQGVGNRPELEGLSTVVAAEVLLQCGVLSGWLGSVQQVPKAQEKAKDLLTEAFRGFQSQGRKVKAAEVQYELSMCYFRLGAYDEARIVLTEALKGLEDADAELRARAHIRRAHLEVWTGRYHDALGVLREAQPFFESCNDAVKGRWHGQLAMVLRRLGTAEGRADYLDRSIIEYEAAAFHLEQAKQERYGAIILNNLAFLLYTLKRYQEAHENLDRAALLLRRLHDGGLLAQVNETRARVLLAEGKYREANRVIVEAIKTLEKGEEAAPLVDALWIQGVAWSRLGKNADSIDVLRRALSVATDSGATSNAAHVLITLIEEHGAARLPELDLYSAYRRADHLLEGTQDAEEIARLRACARIVMARLSGTQMAKDFKLPKAVIKYEAKWIERALADAGGSVTRAAKRLGMSYQALVYLLETRHRKLLPARTPAKKRRRSIIKKKR